MRRFIIERLTDGISEIIISGSQANHLKNVLRIKTDTEIILLDGSGSEYKGRVKDFLGEDILISITGKIIDHSYVPTSISIAFGFLKENKIDDLIRPLTELGTTEILPFISERSISRPDKDKIDKKMGRWEKIASESIKQCKRKTIPSISFFTSLKDVLSYSNGYEKKIMFHENEKTKNLLNDFIDSGRLKPEKAIILIGPEGGFSEKETELAIKNGFETYSLASGILRAETAIISSAAIVQYIYSQREK